MAATLRSPRPRTVEPLIASFPLPMQVDLVRSPRARRLSLRIDPAGGRATLVAPHAAPDRHILDFLRRHTGWLEARSRQLPGRRPFAHGVTVPILGIPHRIEGDSTNLRGLVRRDNGVVVIPGAADHLPRRLTDYLKREARTEIERRARTKCGTLGRNFTALTLRDTISRWGSCSAAGRLAFSWRLILAPEFVLDYVVAHEVAHLAEMNHGPRFWRLCATLTAADPKVARAWLKQNGPQLHSYG